MPIFDYKARNKLGRKIKGDLDAPTLDMAENILRKKGLQDIKVKPKPKDLFEGTPLEKGVSSRDMVVFSRQFATMINSGVPILQALQIMCEQTENDKLRHALFDIRNNIESGSSLYDAMKKYPDVFDTLYTNMVDAGETGGVLDTVLLRLS
jgi:type IV pilus assembly protein PilC